MRTAIATLAVLLVLGCTKSEKHEPAPTPMADALTAKLPELKRQIAACTSDECKRTVQARTVKLATDALVERRVTTSLGSVEQALETWRHGKFSPLAAQNEVINHNTRCDRTIDLLVTAATERPLGILRDAFDAKLLSREDFVAIAGKQLNDVTSIGSIDDVNEGVPVDKRHGFEELLSRGAVLVHLDARRPGVVVPPKFQHDPELVLSLGRGEAVSPPIPDLVVDDRGITATLQFEGKPFPCVIPWAALYGAIQNGAKHGLVWDADVPDDLVSDLAMPR